MYPSPCFVLSEFSLISPKGLTKTRPLELSSIIACRTKIIFAYQILTLSLMYIRTDARQLEIYLLNRVKPPLTGHRLSRRPMAASNQSSEIIGQ